MSIEHRLRRLVRLILSLQKRRDRQGARSQALGHLRIIGNWICGHAGRAALRRKRSSLLERRLSEIATQIYRRRMPQSKRRLVVRLVPMPTTLGQSLFPNQILLHPELCARPEELSMAICHEVAHHTRGIEHDHDRVFLLELSAIHLMHGRAVLRKVLTALRRPSRLT